jgi:hypothetical protein
VVEAKERQYEVHSAPFRSSHDRRSEKLEQFLNSLAGKIVAILPNVTVGALWMHRVDFLWIVEKVH